MIIDLILLIALFALLVRLLPAAWGLPLYLFFLLLIGSFMWRERRRIGRRLTELEQELEARPAAWSEGEEE
jgi:Flp pilus assembly protein TadB